MMLLENMLRPLLVRWTPSLSKISLLARSDDLPRPDCSTKIILSAGREEVARTPLAYLLSFRFRNNGSLDSGSYLGGFSLTKISKAMSVAG